LQTKKAFFKEAIKNFKTAGTITPSSRFLIKKMLHSIDFNTAKVIVEYGPGNGIITHQILNKMQSDCVLICFEINTHFYKHLKEINDGRLIVLKSSAENILIELKKLNINFADYFISSLPLTMLPKLVSQNILVKSKHALRTNGQFIQYQYSLRFYRKFKQIFNKNNVSLNFELANIPPAFIYKCIKK